MKNAAVENYISTTLVGLEPRLVESFQTTIKDGVAALQSALRTKKSEHSADARYAVGPALGYYLDFIKRAIPNSSRLSLDYAVVDNFEQRVTEASKRQAAQLLEQFTAKLREKLNDTVPVDAEIRSRVSFSGSVLESTLDISYEFGSMEVRTKAVWGITRYGQSFYRYPLTFHRVLIDNKKIKGSYQDVKDAMKSR